MAFLLWIDEEADQAIDLGDPLLLFPAFAEMAKVAESDAGWEELFSVTGEGEQTVDPAWLAKVREQAARFRRTHKVGEHAAWILDQLAGTT